MKKVIFFFAFFLALGIATANAQSCSAGSGKSCCANKVAKAAAADPSIEKRTSDDGAVAYVRKEADAQGNVKFVSVQYDEASNKFVNVAPKTISESDKAASTHKACAAGSEKKACCAGGAKSGKACCASKAAATEEKEQ